MPQKYQPARRRLRCGAIPAALAASAMLAGCASLAPPYRRPPLPVDTHYATSANVSSEEGTDAANTGWRDYFTDPTMQRLIASALDNNRDLRMATLREAQAMAAYGIHRADQFPTIGIGADATRARVPGDLNYVGQSLVQSQYDVDLGISRWQLDFWGRIRSLKTEALQTYLASDAARRATTLSLIAQVADAYLRLLELDQRAAIARQTVTSRETSYRIFRLRYRVGATSRLDLTQVQTLLTQARSLNAQLQQARDEQAHALTELVGAPLQLPTAAGALARMPAPPALRAGLPSRLLAARPDIIAAEHRLRAANADIGAARAAFFPSISLTGTYGTSSSALSGLFDRGSKAWTFLPEVSLPLFDAGRRHNNLRYSQAQRDYAVADYEKTVQNAFREVCDALSARHWLRQQLRADRDMLAAQQQRARLAKLRYDAGAARYLEVLDAQRDLLAAEQQLVQTRRAQLSNQVRLYAVLGGGTLIAPRQDAGAALSEVHARRPSPEPR
ncbi:efflux transporter outer membrane subunit [Oleiagrimonas sp. C23AA]|uniref:efflux transporter outer membrane subunit n=1 Tax=Oleiagrimonas sp. C23AA TaxID=2719047 RepID=UPI001423185F|nr:efflux transporter outer membrane subunit [Oleiagrimonas sp. C23AA]NII11815.1 efflux transporter outer membrane subunit [Oleiagrimonas sp. C23AA]